MASVLVLCDPFLHMHTQTAHRPILYLSLSVPGAEDEHLLVL